MAGFVCSCLAAMGLLCASTQGQDNDPLMDFFKAMVRHDKPAMRSVVRLHRDDMAITFFAALRECSEQLKEPGLGDEDATKIRVLLLACSRIARTFDEVYPGSNFLCRQFKDSRPLLTSRVQMDVTSDGSLADFLTSGSERAGEAYKWRDVAADLDSIIAAVTESPAERALRKMRAELERRRREAEERARRERIAKAMAEVTALRKKGDEGALLAMLQDVALDPTVRKAVVQALGELGSHQAVETLSQLLADRTLRKTVVEALGRIGDDQAVKALAARLSDTDIPAQILEAIGKIEGPTAEAALVGALGENATGARSAAILARRWGEQAAGRFLDIVKDRAGSAARRRQAIRALANLPGADTFTTLSAFASDPELKREVAQSLPRTNDPRAVYLLVAMLDDTSIAPVAESGLRQMGAFVHSALVERLRRFSPSSGAKRAARLLERMSYESKGAEEKARRALLLGRVFGAVRCGPAGYAAAVDALRSDDPDLRRTGAKALAVDVGLPVILLVGIVLYRRRKWFWPAIKVCLAPGECRQISNAVKRRAKDADVEPGTIVQTLWAKNRYGRRQRIKVETFASGAEWEDGGDPWQPFVDLSPPEQDDKERDDLLVSVGRSVRPGTYLAWGPNTSVRVNISDGSG